MTILEGLGQKLYLPRFYFWWAEGLLLAQRVGEARGAAEKALTLATELGERSNEAHALRLLGDIAAVNAPHDFVVAESFYERSRTLATELGMRPLIAHCHLGLGKLYRRTGKHEQAQEHLTTATTMYREMDMRFWLERAEAEFRERR